MKFIDLHVRAAMLAHGFNDDYVEIEEKVSSGAFVRKSIAVSRIQSVTKEYLLVNAIAGRQMYWEYQESMDEVVERLRTAGLVV